MTSSTTSASNGYHDHLARYFASRRWFAGKGRDFAVTHVHALPWLTSPHDQRVRIEIVTVDYADGERDTYQFPIVYERESDQSMGHALVGEFEHPELGAVVAYDAVYFRSAAQLFLDAFRRHDQSPELTFEVVDGAELPTDSDHGIVMTAEQSNTSIAYGEHSILKLFRRVSHGGNPDIEIHAALTRHGAEHVAPLLGWVSGSWVDPDGEVHEGDLAMMQVLLRTATDGWDIALSSVRDLLVEGDLRADEVGGDFAGEAHRLGEATAHVHADLEILFDTATLNGSERRGLVEAMNRRLDEAIKIVPELSDHAEGLRRRYSDLGELEQPLPVQRIHGDLHLGQTLRTVKGWKIIDFEGEPAKSLNERLALDSPLRDVAGMLRSLDYAAGITLREFGPNVQLDYRADEWFNRNRTAYLDGYSEAIGDDVARHDVVLRAYEADKAVYEAVYEARNRPSWLVIPLHAIARLAAEE